MFKGQKVCVIMPALNEEASVARVIKEIPQDIVDEIIVVDNGSTDNTAAAAGESGARVLKEGSKGYGACCLKGLSGIKDADIVVILDADHSDYPQQMSRLLQPIADAQADLVVGSRVLGKRENGALAPQAYWGNRLAVFLIQLLFGHRYTDMGPFRAIRFASINSLKMRDKDFGWNAEMQIKAIKRGLKIKEVPVDYRRRIGRSKISGTVAGTIKAGAKIIFTIFKYSIGTTGGR